MIGQEVRKEGLPFKDAWDAKHGYVFCPYWHAMPAH